MNDNSFLEKSAKWYNSGEGFKGNWGKFHKRLMNYRFLTIENWLKGENCLEFGTADGESTQYLLKYFKKVVAVEGAEHFCNFVKQRFVNHLNSGRFQVHLSLFENFTCNERFDVVLALHILEHLTNAVSFLKHAKRFLRASGILIIVVPNAQSIHRLAAVKMGLLEVPHSLNPQDKKLGHCRVYYPQELLDDINRAGLEIIHHGGIFFKPLTNKQIEDNWTEQMIDGFYALGKDFPEYSAEIYTVCQLPRS